MKLRRTLLTIGLKSISLMKCFLTRTRKLEKPVRRLLFSLRQKVCNPPKSLLFPLGLNDFFLWSSLLFSVKLLLFGACSSATDQDPFVPPTPLHRSGSRIARGPGDGGGRLPAEVPTGAGPLPRPHALRHPATWGPSGRAEERSG